MHVPGDAEGRSQRGRMNKSEADCGGVGVVVVKVMVVKVGSVCRSVVVVVVGGGGGGGV